MITRPFDSWNYEEVEIAFGLKESEPTEQFENWLGAGQDNDFAPTETERKSLDDNGKLLLKEVKNWNEDELKFFFIGPLLNLVNFYSPHFKPFTQRTLNITHETFSTSGKVDYMIAKGKSIPRQPYFCLHEYKQENRRDNDPLGQLLIGMLAVHEANEPKIPIYGCYVSGRNWFFVLLEGDKYCLSNAYNAADTAIYQIFSILKKCRSLIEVIASQETSKSSLTQ
jgi:hypothetical protein